jgi:cytochrome c-type biogenesis protein CcmH/NrfG
MKSEPESKQPGAGKVYVKRETMLVVAFVALITGFLGGVIFTVYKSDVPAPMSSSPASMPPQQSRGLSPEQKELLQALQAKVAAEPQNVRAWTDLGHLYFDSNQFRKAIDAYKKSLALNPENADVWTDLGVMYRRSGRPSDAVAAFDRALEAEPLHEISRFNKGIVLMHDLNDPEGAIKTWEELVRINPAARAPNGQPLKELIENLREE